MLTALLFEVGFEIKLFNACQPVHSETFTETGLSLDGSYLCNVDDSSVSSDLREITVSVGYDLNGNSTLETDEIEVTLATLVAKRW